MVDVYVPDGLRMTSTLQREIASCLNPPCRFMVTYLPIKGFGEHVKLICDPGEI